MPKITKKKKKVTCLKMYKIWETEMMKNYKKKYIKINYKINKT